MDTLIPQQLRAGARKKLTEERRALVRRHLAAASEAVEQGDDEAVDKALRALAVAANDGLYVGVARLVRGLHQDLEDLHFQTLARIADAELPDACASLDHVVQLTEGAAHRTLDFVEAGRGLVERIGRIAAGLQAPASAPAADPFHQRRMDASRAELEASGAALRQQLSELTLAQGYQDITGQIIRRVIALVRRLDTALNQLIGDAALPPEIAAPVPTGNGLPGPAVPGCGRPSASQVEADQLLSGLGL